MLLQTKDVQHLCVSYVVDMLKLWLKHVYFYAQTTLHLIRVMKMCLGLEYSVCSSQTWLEMSKTLVKNMWFAHYKHSYKCPKLSLKYGRYKHGWKCPELLLKNNKFGCYKLCWKCPEYSFKKKTWFGPNKCS